MATTYTPKTIDDCITIIDTILPKEEKEVFKKMSLSEFTTSVHFGLGMWIRNNLGAWNSDAALVKNTGLSGDSLSHAVLEAYYTHLTK
ncbi:MAG: DUF6794 domain-containing protein [Kordia sp.]|uniref:DUF6794 domain-containing protein n=1 Tax=Kordia sp. TaxID=1965332 RepID=UPI00385AC1FB